MSLTPLGLSKKSLPTETDCQMPGLGLSCTTHFHEMMMSFCDMCSHRTAPQLRRPRFGLCASVCADSRRRGLCGNAVVGGSICLTVRILRTAAADGEHILPYSLCIVHRKQCRLHVASMFLSHRSHEALLRIFSSDNTCCDSAARSSGALAFRIWTSQFRPFVSCQSTTPERTSGSIARCISESQC